MAAKARCMCCFDGKRALRAGIDYDRGLVLVRPPIFSVAAAQVQHRDDTVSSPFADNAHRVRKTADWSTPHVQDRVSHRWSSGLKVRGI